MIQVNALFEAMVKAFAVLLRRGFDLPLVRELEGKPKLTGPETRGPPRIASDDGVSPWKSWVVNTISRAVVGKGVAEALKVCFDSTKSDLERRVEHGGVAVIWHDVAGFSQGIRFVNLSDRRFQTVPCRNQNTPEQSRVPPDNGLRSPS